jgi:lipopolysaccharide/colanic/teichoic acid biosynthesis glycosyltransferase
MSDADVQRVVDAVRGILGDMAKRAFDLLGASLGLLLLSPLMLAIAVAIKLDSRGPVFFRQQRVGRHGVPFASTSSAPWWPMRRSADRR